MANKTVDLKQLDTQANNVFGEEFEHEPVPVSARRTTFSVSMVWIGLNYLTMTVVAGVLYLGVTFIGIQGLHWIGVVSVPPFVLLGGWVALHSGSAAGWDKVVSYAGVNPQVPMVFGVGLTIVLTLFVDAGTVAADFNRWAAQPTSGPSSFHGCPSSESSFRRSARSSSQTCSSSDPLQGSMPTGAPGLS